MASLVNVTKIGKEAGLGIFRLPRAWLVMERDAGCVPHLLRCVRDFGIELGLSSCLAAFSRNGSCTEEDLV